MVERNVKQRERERIEKGGGRERRMGKRGDEE